MIPPGQSVRLVVATRPVDVRKGQDGLVAVVQEQLGFDPHSGPIVVFRSKRGDRGKILFWDDEPGRAIGLCDNGEWADDDLQAPGTGRLHLARGARRRDAPVEGAVRGALRR